MENQPVQHNNSFSKKKFVLIFLIVALLIAVGLGVFFFLRPQGLTPTSPSQQKEEVAPNMLLSFNPNTLTVSKNASFSADVVFDTYGNPASGIQVVISYDTQQLSNVTFTPFEDSTSALSYALNAVPPEVETDPTTGTILATFTMPESVPEQKGKGIIGKVTGRITSQAESTILRMDTTSQAYSRTFSPIILGKVNLDIDVRN